MSKLLTADDLAARWQVPKSHVYRLTREGKVPAVKLGKYYRYRPDAIERFELGEGRCSMCSPIQSEPAGCANTATGSEREGRYPSMPSQHATGHIRVLPRNGGEVFYAKLKVPRPDGTVYEPQHRLGRVWTKRSRPPAGYLTRAQAEARLAAILAGDDALVNVEPRRVVVTFREAYDEHLRYLEFDRQRKASYVKDLVDDPGLPIASTRRRYAGPRRHDGRR